MATFVFLLRTQRKTLKPGQTSPGKLIKKEDFREEFRRAESGMSPQGLVAQVAH